MLDEATSFLQVDVTILTTGQSSSGRKRRQEVSFTCFHKCSACICAFFHFSSSPGCGRSEGLAEKEDQSWLDQHWHPAQGPNSFKQVVGGSHFYVHLAIYKLFNFSCPLKASLMFRSSRRPQTCRSQETCMRMLLEIYRRSRSFVTWHLPSHPHVDISLSSLIAPLAKHHPIWLFL